ncbi:hypothetical protein COT94_02005 [Candidatus Falkowbacteria bacterium CG10_big_fil_rev_8_21_14_0_10_37_14]|uniref:Conjugal transfer protein TrbC n=1 Tax=Candidatus Falkowbacteria bacterium CG10_big_fil_rev_8_21_14_0_10_37_14 TaxID=1974561 RepID=A0A2M6WT88_9BACT|nr:hypothetical protein [Candidatus Falkowbacteria bacterium]PIT96017.1 MAG: hypothetical protein COT94_02005 [Candidatus Falkowbacteria bacterium CG10_big_fil_rev_8_21_14_0_10_37_14]
MFIKNYKGLAVVLSGLETTANGSGFSKATAVDISTNILAKTMSFLAVIFLLLMMYGGFLWMTAVGNDSRIKTSQTLITSAMIGLLVIAAAYAITAFLGDTFTVK